VQASASGAAPRVLEFGPGQRFVLRSEDVNWFEIEYNGSHAWVPHVEAKLCWTTIRPR